MEQRDIIMDEIERLGKAISKILSGILGAKGDLKTSKLVSIANENFKAQVDLDIEKLVNLSKEELFDFIQSKNFVASHLQLICEYLKEAGIIKMGNDKKLALKYFQRALELYGVIEEFTKTFSFEVLTKKEDISQLISDCKLP